LGVRHTLGVHVEAHFGCEAHELVMVGDRCVCVYMFVCETHFGCARGGTLWV